MSHYNNEELRIDDGLNVNNVTRGELQSQGMYNVDPLLLVDLWEVLNSLYDSPESGTTSGNAGVVSIKLSNSKFNYCVFNMFGSLDAYACPSSTATGIHGSSITSTSTCRNISALLHFEFANCVDLTDLMVDLLCACCPNIVYLDIQNCTLLTDEAIRSISKLGSKVGTRDFVGAALKHLNIGHNVASVSAIAALVASGVGCGLETLCLRGLQCDDSFRFPLVKSSPPRHLPPGSNSESVAAVHICVDGPVIRDLDVSSLRCLHETELRLLLPAAVGLVLRSLIASDSNMSNEIIIDCFSLSLDTSVSGVQNSDPDSTCTSISTGSDSDSGVDISMHPETVLCREGATYESLQQLELSWCDEVSTDVLNHSLAKCPNLASIALRNTTANSSSVHTVAMYCYRMLTKLDISSCSDVNNTCMLHLAETCVSLRFLDISWSFIEDSGLEKLLRRCSDIEILLLQGCKHLTSPTELELEVDLQACKTEMTNTTNCCVLNIAKYPCDALAFLDFSWTNMMSKVYAVAISNLRPKVTVIDYYMQAFKNGHMTHEYL